MEFNKIKEESRNICPAEDNEIDKLFSQKCFCIAGGSNPEKLYEKLYLLIVIGFAIFVATSIQNSCSIN